MGHSGRRSELYLNGLYPGFNHNGLGSTSKAYGSMFWAGLPIAITALDPWNFELDLNYGYVEAMGRFDVEKRFGSGDWKRGSTERQAFWPRPSLNTRWNGVFPASSAGTHRATTAT